jgi:hypothetical protein
MNVVRFVRIMSLVLVCLVFLLTFSALSIEALAQDGIWDKTKEGVKKGAEGVKKGAETVGEKTKEGAEAVGEGVKDVFTDDEDADSVSREKAREAETQQPATQPSDTTSPADTSSPRTTDMDSRSAEERGLPATAGQLPLLALAGAFAFAGAVISKVLRGN